jgi:hypothetical protein
MSTRGTTTPTERIDVLLQHARQFYALDLVGEAIARTRHVLAQCDEEARATRDESTLREIETRRTYALQMLERLGGRRIRPAPERATI